jgi:D-tyrosyl-tRNA(Tyr) deacylase
MRIVLQRVREAQVRVDEADPPGGGGGGLVGQVGPGVLLLVGVARGDTEADADALARKVAALRIFPGRTPMDRTLAETGGGCLVVSQFTLAGSVRKGRRPGFGGAEDPPRAQALVERLADGLRAAGLPVASGRFGARMQVALVNDGPVTFVLDAQDGRVR